MKKYRVYYKWQVSKKEKYIDMIAEDLVDLAEKLKSQYLTQSQFDNIYKIKLLDRHVYIQRR